MIPTRKFFRFALVSVVFLQLLFSLVCSLNGFTTAAFAIPVNGTKNFYIVDFVLHTLYG